MSLPRNVGMWSIIAAFLGQPLIFDGMFVILKVLSPLSYKSEISVSYCVICVYVRENNPGD